ncbi:RNA polymerase sigma factor [Flavihumibacter stibioxidans]|uniref:HTH luxR-type domain-containing protein n=1 Tax=Flavihumibacter stibioxidans TaxID=1834163 RepID=A0ABR7M8Q2_9BACT|nr:sigma-70 family RNA polymerase sigma factor [Flavihumibacter stibioxidans]MBC6491401.1 hypothetical protein [Flavihumibacter stibioxidans]
MPIETAQITNDHQLLMELKSGSNLAFDALYDRYWEAVYTAAYKRLRDESSAKDITQDIFLQVWLRRNELEISNLKAYLLTAVRNNVLKKMEKENRFVPVPLLLLQLKTAGDKADADLMEKEFLKLYDAMVQSLTPSQQQIFRMRFQHDLSTEEIAEKLDISRKTVQNQLGKSVARLRESLLFFAVLFLLD